MLDCIFLFDYVAEIAVDIEERLLLDDGRAISAR